MPTTRTPQFSGPSTISPGSPATGPTGTLLTDEVQSGVVRGAGQPTGRVSTASSGQAMRRRVEATTEDLQAASQRWLDASRSNVRNRPLTWVGVALAAGALIARLVR